MKISVDKNIILCNNVYINREQRVDPEKFITESLSDYPLKAGSNITPPPLHQSVDYPQGLRSFPLS